MQAELKVQCGGCGEKVGAVMVDTADEAEELQVKINKVILAHRTSCRYYSGRELSLLETISDSAGLRELRQAWSRARHIVEG